MFHGKSLVHTSASGPRNVLISQLATAYYFAHFLVILPILGLYERPVDLPLSISGGSTADDAPAAQAAE